jgi:hypothetical protein
MSVQSASVYVVLSSTSCFSRFQPKLPAYAHRVRPQVYVRRHAKARSISLPLQLFLPWVRRPFLVFVKQLKSTYGCVWPSPSSLTISRYDERIWSISTLFYHIYRCGDVRHLSWMSLDLYVKNLAIRTTVYCPMLVRRASEPSEQSDASRWADG